MKNYGYIEDGYNRPGYIEGRRNMYDELRFEYRPVLYVDRVKILEKYRDPKQASTAIRTIVQHVIKWDLKKPTRNDEGKITGEEAVELNKDEVWRVHPDLMDAIFMIIVGQIPCDTDPEWTDEEKQQADDDEFEAALSGTDPSFEREKGDSKNSETG